MKDYIKGICNDINEIRAVHNKLCECTKIFFPSSAAFLFFYKYIFCRDVNSTTAFLR